MYNSRHSSFHKKYNKWPIVLTLTAATIGLVFVLKYISQFIIIFPGPLSFLQLQFSEIGYLILFFMFPLSIALPSALLSAVVANAIYTGAFYYPGRWPGHLLDFINSICVIFTFAILFWFFLSTKKSKSEVILSVCSLAFFYLLMVGFNMLMNYSWVLRAYGIYFGPETQQLFFKYWYLFLAFNFIRFGILYFIALQAIVLLFLSFSRKSAVINLKELKIKYNRTNEKHKI